MNQRLQGNLRYGSSLQNAQHLLEGNSSYVVRNGDKTFVTFAVTSFYCSKFKVYYPKVSFSIESNFGNDACAKSNACGLFPAPPCMN